MMMMIIDHRDHRFAMSFAMADAGRTSAEMEGKLLIYDVESYRTILLSARVQISC